MAETLVQMLLNNLSPLIQGEIGLIMGVDDEMKKLQSTLTTIQAVLEDAEMKHVESKAIRDWLCKLNDLTFEIEDILDECSTKVEKLKHKGSESVTSKLKRFLNKREIGKRMKEVTKKLDVVAEEHSKFHLRETVVQKQSKEVVLARETGSALNDSEPVYGRVEEKEKIVDMLVNQVRDCEQLSIVPIVGIGGVGKTTLAQLVFNDPQVVKHFEAKIWVCVSDNFDLKALIKAMIESGTKSGIVSNLERLDALQGRLGELLNKKRYLLVLDDVWNEDQNKWFDLKNVLACGFDGASVILTTRIKKIADMMSTVPAHEVKGLSKENCWLLFKQRAFGQKEEQYPNLEAIGKEIVNKCSGIPLAAKTLGGLLRFKKEEKEWLHVKESEIWNLPQEETSILPALRLSYHHLPLALRQCFAYCAVFPKDSVVEKEELIRLWMIHGYISSNGILEVEDVGNGIWNELVLRSLFQDIHTNGRTTTFKMHDLVHDLAQSIMSSKIPETQAQSNIENPLNNKIRQVHLSTYFVAFPTTYLPNMDLSFVLNKFSRLRSLDASGTRVKDLPSSIGKLKHLRSLNLSETKICTLPDTICSLWNLKILNLNKCEELERLPKDMRYMRNLRYLYLEECQSLSQTPSNIGELSSLKALNVFIVGHEKGNQLEELEWLNLGGTLEIKHLERVKSHIDAEKANLVGKQNLHILRLQWEADILSKVGENEDDKILEVLEPYSNLETLMISGFKGKNFPFWMSISTLGNIIRMKILKCPNCLRLPLALGELPHLKSLHLQNLRVEYITENEVNIANSINPKFPSLNELKLYDLLSLKSLLKEEVGDSFPNLRTLHARGCPLLILPQLPSLKLLQFDNRSKMILTSPSKIHNLNDLWMFNDEKSTLVPTEAFKHLTNLKSLSIWGLDEQNLPEECWQALKSLTCLNISECNKLLHVSSKSLAHLTNLENLFIQDCADCTDLPDQIEDLHKLSCVWLQGLPAMKCVPRALKFLPSLKYLVLSSLTQLASLPYWLDDCTSLLRLEIENCPKLVSFPHSIKRMQNLQTLSIAHCPVLKMRGEKDKGEDWHKIKHIPEICIDDDQIDLKASLIYHLKGMGRHLGVHIKTGAIMCFYRLHQGTNQVEAFDRGIPNSGAGEETWCEVSSEGGEENITDQFKWRTFVSPALQLNFVDGGFIIFRGADSSMNVL